MYLLPKPSSMFSNVPSYTHVQRNGLDAVALVLEATQASSTGNFETLGSKFSNETAKLAACVLRYSSQVQFRPIKGKKTPNSILSGVFSYHYSSSSSKKVFNTSSIISHSSSVSIGSKSPSVPSSASTYENA